MFNRRDPELAQLYEAEKKVRESIEKSKKKGKGIGFDFGGPQAPPHPPGGNNPPQQPQAQA